MSREWLRSVALAEATSFLVLLAATVIKYAFDAPGGVRVLGPIHGVLFLAYVGLVLYERQERGWNGQQTLLGLISAVVPLGGFWFERRMLRPAA